MNAEHTDKPCIEVELLGGARKSFSISEYEAAQEKARTLGPRARSFHRVVWAEQAPPVEQLTVEWCKPGPERFRISDRDAYDAQMRRLMGLRGP